MGEKTPENIRRRSTREAPGLGSDIFRLIYQMATAFTGARPSDLFGRADSMGNMGDMPGMDGMGDMGDMPGMDGMDHGSHSGGGHDMGGMDMGHGPGCKLSMLGNWNTIGTCILTSSWYNDTHAKFAGTCIGVACWVILTEIVRRWSREFDRYIIAKATRDIVESQSTPTDRWITEKYKEDFDAEDHRAEVDRQGPGTFPSNVLTSFFHPPGRLSARGIPIHPTLVQQLVRALFYAVQFTSAYLLMLISMSYNGYILLSMMLGALVGHFVSSWDTLGYLSPSILKKGGKSTQSYAAVGPADNQEDVFMYMA